MELGLSLGDSSKPSFNNHLGLGLNTTLSIGPSITTKSCDHHLQQEDDIEDEEEEEEEEEGEDSDDEAKKEKRRSSIIDHEASNKLIPAVSVSVSPKAIPHNNSLQLDLLPRTPVLPLLSSFPWPPPSDHNNSGEVAGSSRLASAVEDESEERAALSSSPNSAASSFQVDLCIYSKGGGGGGGGSSSMSMSMMSSGSGNIKKKKNNNRNTKMDSESESYYDQKGGCRGSDEEDNVGGGGGTRKKLRLSKEQSAFLEDSFKEHSTLNPKQKLALAKQLNLRPRQVEVWFQNRRARTKLKQTEVECEYLKRWCETLSEEKRRLEKELQEVKALKASSSNPFFTQLPPTTLTMCPSCERVAPNSNSSSSKPIPNAFPLVHAKPKFHPFPHSKPHH